RRRRGPGDARRRSLRAPRDDRCEAETLRQRSEPMQLPANAPDPRRPSGRRRIARRSRRHVASLPTCEGLEARSLLATIPLPTIPNRTFDVTTFGAVGDGVSNNTTAIQAAINAAS